MNPTSERTRRHIVASANLRIAGQLEGVQLGEQSPKRAILTITTICKTAQQQEVYAEGIRAIALITSYI